MSFEELSHDLLVEYPNDSELLTQSTCFINGISFNPRLPDFLSPLTWVNLTWDIHTYDEYCNVPINISLYSGNNAEKILVKNLASLSIEAKSFYWKTEDPMLYGGYERMYYVDINGLDRDGTRRTFGRSGWFRFGSTGGACNSTTGRIDYKNNQDLLTFVSGDELKITTPNCWINIPFVDIAFYDYTQLKFYYLKKGVQNTKNTISLIVPPDVPGSSTYYLMFGVEGSPPIFSAPWALWRPFVNADAYVGSTIKYRKPPLNHMSATQLT